jgi:hypothetical protein
MNDAVIGCYAFISRIRGRELVFPFPAPKTKYKFVEQYGGMQFKRMLINLKLGWSSDDTERSERFWNASSVELKFGLERMWLDAVWKCPKKPNFAMRGLDPILEERASYK